VIITQPAGRANGKTYSVKETLLKVRLEDRYEAAIRLEKARQNIRETGRYGFPVTRAHREEVHAAEAAYNHATAVLQAIEG
jgi:hypothetical protein